MKKLTSRRRCPTLLPPEGLLLGGACFLEGTVLAGGWSGSGLRLCQGARDILGRGSRYVAGSQRADDADLGRSGTNKPA